MNEKLSPLGTAMIAGLTQHCNKLEEQEVITWNRKFKIADTSHLYGEIIFDELMSRQLTPVEFSKLLGYSMYSTSLLIGGLLEMTPVIAEDLARVFGTSVELWMDLKPLDSMH